MSKAIYFDLRADDPERAARFYKDVFNWNTEQTEDPIYHWRIDTGDYKEPGIAGGVAKRAEPTDRTAIIYDVPSVYEFSGKIKASGGEIVEPKRAIQGIGYLVMCKDSEGNKFGIMQLDESAA